MLAGETSLVIKASTETLYDMVSDITRMGEWSPENRGGKWLKGATKAAPGVRFRGFNKRGFARWPTTCEVVSADPRTRFAFDVLIAGRHYTRWAYDFEPAGDGATKVTESHKQMFMLPAAQFVWKVILTSPDRQQVLIDGMRQTLENLKSAAESRK